MNTELDSTEFRLGICLSGGGARGIAHIGVLKALGEAGITPTVVSGTSSGAIIASLYAFGLSIDQIIDFAKFGSALKIFRVGNPLKGLIKLSLLREKLESVFEIDDFSCLERSLAIVASDLQRGRVAIFREGPIIEAVQASCAIPLVFRPVEIGGYQYIDGGLFLNLPAEPIRDACDFLIGSNVMPLIEAETGAYTSIVGIGNRVFDLSVNMNTERSAKLCDYVIEPAEITGYHVYNFTRTDELIDLGYQATLLEIERLKRAVAESSELATTAAQKSSTRQGSV